MNQPVHAIAAAAGATPRVFAAVGSGLFRTADEGINWQALHLRPAGQRQPAVHMIVADPVNASVQYVATDLDDGALWRTRDGGDSWAMANRGLPTGRGAVESLHMVPGNRLTLYAKIRDEVYKTVDGGDNWTMQSKLRGEIGAFTIAPSDPTVMFHNLVNQVFLSLDEGRTWTPKFPLSLAAGTQVAIIAVSPVNPSTVFIAARGSGDGFGLYRSTDQGENFTILLPIQVASIKLDPGGRLVYASTLQEVCLVLSRDEGRFWENFCPGSGLRDVTVSPEPTTPAVIWAATSSGVFRFLDPVTRWQTRNGFVRPTLFSPATTARYDFFLPPGGRGQLDLPVELVESDRWSAPVSVTPSGESWLTVTGVPAATRATATVRVNAQGLAEGTHSGTVRISSTQANNSPVVIPVRVTVRAAGAGDGYTITTATGIGQNATFGDGGPANLAGIGPPDSVAADANGNVYISDPTNNRVRRIRSNGNIERFAGTGQPNFSGDGGDALLAGFQGPRGLGIDSDQRVLVGDTGNNRVRRVTADRFVISVTDQLPAPRGVAADRNGNVYVTLRDFHNVMRVAPDGTVSRFAGIGLAGYRADGVNANETRLNTPTDVVVDAAGNVYIADSGNHRIRRVRPNGIIETVAGNGVSGFQGDGTATEVGLSRPTGIALDGAGNLLIADTDNQRVRVLNTQGQLRTIAGTGTGGFRGDGGAALSAEFQSPVDVAVDPAGSVYVADNLNIRVRKLTPPAPVVRPEISSGGFVNAADGTPRLSPGGLFSVFGRNLAGATQQAGGVPWPETMGGVQVTVNGRVAPLYFISPGQINGQVPYETTVGDAIVRVTVNGVASQEATVRITATAPGILMFGAGRAVAQNPDASVNTAENPIAAGAVIVVYLSGQGLLDNPVATGAGATSSPLSRPMAEVSATIGGREASVLFLGMSPGFVGLAQANLVVPELPPGDYDVVITIGLAVSNAAKITVGGV